MKLNGWTWLIAGLLVSCVSGYVYLFIPKNGSPNTAMALFFFIGIIFMVVGVLKILFTHKEDQIIMSAIKAPERKTPVMPVVENRQNRVEQQLNQMMNEQTQAPMQTSNINNAQITNNNINKTNHTNSFYNKYQYSGPVHQTNATHAQHPAQASQTHTTTNPTQHHSQHIQNAEHGLRCKSCSNVNSAHANYCHQCGHRLR